MTRNSYDSDATVWSPHGRLFQVEYAVEAVKLGSATVAIKSDKYAVLVGLKRNFKLATHQKKIIVIDKHIGVALSGLTADARIICKYLRTEALNYTYEYSEPIPLLRLMNNLSKKIQMTTQRYDKRPFGVGLLIIGYDIKGTHVFEVKPNNIMSCKAMAMGSRSQSAKTFLEKNLSNFEKCSQDVLIKEALRAVKETLSSDQDLTSSSVSVAILGKDLPIKELNEDEINKHVSVVTQEKRRSYVETEPKPDHEVTDIGGDDIFHEAQSSTNL